MSGKQTTRPRVDGRQLGLGALALAAPLLLSSARLVAQQMAAQQVGTHGAITAQDSLPVFHTRIDSLLGVLNRATVMSPQSVQALAMMQELLTAAAIAGGGQVSKLFVSGSISNAYLHNPADGTRFLATILPKGWLGVTLDAYGTEQLTDNGFIVRYTQYPAVFAVEPNSPAGVAGILVRDTVIAFNDADLRGGAINLTQLEQPGKVLKVQVVRAGQSRVFTIRIETAPSEYAQARLKSLDSLTRELVAASPPTADPNRVLAPAPSGRVGFVLPNVAPGAWGATLQELNPERGKPFGEPKGLLVTSADSATLAFRMVGLRQWDVVLQIDKRPVASYDDFQIALRQHPAGQPIELLISREHKRKTLKLDPSRWPPGSD
jgi:S1-C subfamily serine protease